MSAGDVSHSGLRARGASGDARTQRLRRVLSQVGAGGEAAGARCRNCWIRGIISTSGSIFRHAPTIACCARRFAWMVKCALTIFGRKSAATVCAPLTLVREDDGTWRTRFKLPPGLTPGWHDVTLRVGNSPMSNAKRIAVDFPEAGAARIASVMDGTTWERGDSEPFARRGNFPAWVTGLPENADTVNTRAATRRTCRKMIYRVR